MISKTTLLAVTAGGIAALASFGAAAVEAKGSIYGDLRYGITHFGSDDAGGGNGFGEQIFAHDNGSYFGLKASTTADGITAFGAFEHIIDTDNCFNYLQYYDDSDVGQSNTTYCQGDVHGLRQAYAGVSGGFGSVSYGTMETEYAKNARRYDPFYNTGVSDVATLINSPLEYYALGLGMGQSYGGSLLTLPLTANAFAVNQLTYVSPEIAGFTGNVSYFFPEVQDTSGDVGVGVNWSMGGITAGVQHLAIRTSYDAQTFSSSYTRGNIDPHFISMDSTCCGGPNQSFEADATLVQAGYQTDAFGASATYELMDIHTFGPGFVDPTNLQIAGWFGVMPGTRVAATYGLVNESFTEGTGVTAGVFHDLVQGLTVHAAASMIDGSAASFDYNGIGADNYTLYTIGASYKFDLGFSGNVASK